MARPVPPLGRHLVSFGAVARCRAPHPGRAIQSSGVPAANGGARLRGRLRGSLPCSRRRRPVFSRGVGGGGVSFRSGVARSPVRGAVFAPGGRVAAGRGRVPPYGPQAGLGRNASPPGVPPSPWESGVAVGHDLNLPRLTPGLKASAQEVLKPLVSSRPFGHFWQQALDVVCPFRAGYYM